MKNIKTAKYAGKEERGKRDGTGPYKGSLQRKLKDKGKRKEIGEKCPIDKKAQLGTNPFSWDPDYAPGVSDANIGGEGVDSSPLLESTGDFVVEREPVNVNVSYTLDKEIEDITNKEVITVRIDRINKITDNIGSDITDFGLLDVERDQIESQIKEYANNIQDQLGGSDVGEGRF